MAESTVPAFDDRRDLLGVLPFWPNPTSHPTSSWKNGSGSLI